MSQTFADFLPCRISNDIYELVAADINLHLFAPSAKSNKRKPPPGLLLSNRQCRNEFLPILLSSASVKASITDFDFSPLIRVAGSLYSTELKALRTNPNLKISLRMKRCTNQVYVNLRRWCINRVASLDRLPWAYGLDAEAKANTEQLRWFCERAKVLYEKLREEESVRAEVQRVLEVLEKGLGVGRDDVRREWMGGFGDDFITMAATRRQRPG